jgi:hypothetical protein
LAVKEWGAQPRTVNAKIAGPSRFPRIVVGSPERSKRRAEIDSQKSLQGVVPLAWPLCSPLLRVSAPFRSNARNQPDFEVQPQRERSAFKGVECRAALGRIE